MTGTSPTQTVLDLNSLTTKAIAVNYIWENTTHLLRAGVDKERNLYVLEYLNYPPSTLISTIVEYTREYRKYNVFSNEFEPLKVQIGGFCRQFSEDITKNLDVFYKNLRASGNFHVLEGIPLPNKDPGFLLCMSFLLKGFMADLCGAAKSGGLFLPTPSDDDIENIGYDRHNSLPWEEERQMRTDLKIAAYEAVMTRGGYLKVKQEKNYSGILTAIWARENLVYRAYYSGEMFALHEKIFYASENSINRN